MGVGSSGELLLIALAGAAYAFVELFNEGTMPALFNPAKLELTGGYGLSALTLLILYSLSYLGTVISLYDNKNSLGSKNFKEIMPLVSIPLLAPIDLLAAVQSLYVLTYGMQLTHEKVDITSSVTVTGSNKFWQLRVSDGDSLYIGNGGFSQDLTVTSCTEVQL